MRKLHMRKGIVFTYILFYLSLTGVDAQTVKDADGNIYMTIKIGNQIWIAENLKTTKFIDGKSIPLVTDETKWKGMSTPACCWYKNDINNKAVYGALYNWYAVKTGKLCPTGWHVPTDKEWQTMVEFLGDPLFAGDRLKEPGTAHWRNPVSAATNDFDFTGLPGSMRFSTGIFADYSYAFAMWWTSTEFDATQAWIRGLRDQSSAVYKGYDNFGNGFSVRCIMD